MANGGGPFGIGDQILRGFFGNETLRDYTHASRVFTTNSYELKPRYKFLFHVSFTLNTEVNFIKQAFPDKTSDSLSLLVKTVDLPKYNIDYDTFNQYNRKRLIQTKINYQPINITFHDDGGDNARKLWYYYYAYYYKDATQNYLDGANAQNGSLGESATRQAGFGYNARDVYNSTLNVKDWGYIGESWLDGSAGTGAKPAFFKDIRIFGLDQRKYVSYVLINPMITAFNHDTYNYSEGNGTMTNTMTVAYETVKYYSGAVGAGRPDNNVKGFADPAHYDTRLSPIARPGSNATIFGQGGVLDAAEGILTDLNSGGLGGLVGAVQKAGALKNTWKGKNIAATAVNETVTLGKNSLLGALPGATKGVLFPTASKK